MDQQVEQCSTVLTTRHNYLLSATGILQSDTVELLSVIEFGFQLRPGVWSTYADDTVDTVERGSWRAELRWQESQPFGAGNMGEHNVSVVVAAPLS